MIKRRTVFVLGAGSSAPYGFSTGAKLLQSARKMSVEQMSEATEGCFQPRQMAEDRFMCWSRLWDALNNASLAATIGAVLATVGAITTVFITDWLRTRRKARVAIPSLLRRQRTLAANRRDTEEKALADRSGNQASS